jgi:hypothetical protein
MGDTHGPTERFAGYARNRPRGGERAPCEPAAHRVGSTKTEEKPHDKRREKTRSRQKTDQEEEEFLTGSADEEVGLVPCCLLLFSRQQALLTSSDRVFSLRLSCGFSSLFL